ncbi:hypothetical protein Nepgr_030958 [Nepenthes gracilis]|uniref:Tyrosine specific protein phosphatases domain-containing protein n=1 Tax=Nepenthes gracilis TaxID=150966 RepID=A0AAD3Y6B4_NEPGR|nr:hypothetical protein Nepgr_030958 [Nepenthes gracilis]
MIVNFASGAKKGASWISCCGSGDLAFLLSEKLELMASPTFAGDKIPSPVTLDKTLKQNFLAPLPDFKSYRKNESCGKTTYVHCKAGRGRSTTVVLCYLVEHKHMTHDAAYEYVWFIRLLLREFQASGFEAI